ncbi:MAG TPA: carboxypeptidase regulatory-like domain-containing protein, partial [Candidatus Sulfotelmatobacter sp.]
MRIALVVFLLTSFTVAQTLTGTVRNSTTGKPSAGDEVVIFKLSQGMEESGRTKTNAEGQFSFTLD